MNIELLEVERTESEIFFNIVDKDSNNVVGIIFSVENHIAYEIKPQYRGNGAATTALKMIISKIKRPVLEIKYNNFASIRVAQKSGFVLVRNEYPFGIYEYKPRTK